MAVVKDVLSTECRTMWCVPTMRLLHENTMSMLAWLMLNIHARLSGTENSAAIHVVEDGGGCAFTGRDGLNACERFVHEGEGDAGICFLLDAKNGLAEGRTIGECGCGRAVVGEIHRGGCAPKVALVAYPSVVALVGRLLCTIGWDNLVALEIHIIVHTVGDPIVPVEIDVCNEHTRTEEGREPG